MSIIESNTNVANTGSDLIAQVRDLADTLVTRDKRIDGLEQALGKVQQVVLEELGQGNLDSGIAERIAQAGGFDLEFEVEAEVRVKATGDLPVDIDLDEDMLREQVEEADIEETDGWDVEGIDMGWLVATITVTPTFTAYRTMTVTFTAPALDGDDYQEALLEAVQDSLLGDWDVEDVAVLDRTVL